MDINPSQAEIMQRYGTKKSPKRDLADNIYSSFAGMHSKIRLYRALFYGHEMVGGLFQSNTKAIATPAMPIIDELKSYIKGRMRMPSVSAKNSYIDSKLVAEVDKIVSSIYIKERVEDTILSAWQDFMICGVGILKIHDDTTKLISHTCISPLACIWDTADTDNPQYFIHEEILSNDVASRKYGIDQVKYESAFSNISKPKIIYSENNWESEATATFASNEGKTLYNKKLDSIYTAEFQKKMVYEKPSIGSSCIRHEYRSCNALINGEVKHVYSYTLFVNDQKIESPVAIPASQKPFIILCNRDRSSHVFKSMYPCFLDRIKGDILAYNILSNTQLDCFISSASASGLVIMKDDNIVDGSNAKNDSSLKLKILRVKAGIDSSVGDVVTKTPPADISVTVANEMTNCITRIRNASGLLSFDTNSLSSGYHESLRLDREFSNVSIWLTQLDNTIIRVGEVISEIVGECFKKDVSFLEKYIDSPEDLHGREEDFEALFANGVQYNVTEMPASDSNKQRLVASLQILTELTGDKLPIPASQLADLMHLPQEVSNMLAQTNIQDDTQKKIVESEIKKNVATSVKDMAMAEKNLAESRESKNG